MSPWGSLATLECADAVVDPASAITAMHANTKRTRIDTPLPLGRETSSARSRPCDSRRRGMGVTLRCHRNRGGPLRHRMTPRVASLRTPSGRTVLCLVVLLLVGACTSQVQSHGCEGPAGDPVMLVDR